MSFITAGIIVLAGLDASILYSYLLFHSLAEGFSIVAAYGVFIIGSKLNESLNKEEILDMSFVIQRRSSCNRSGGGTYLWFYPLRSWFFVPEFYALLTYYVTLPTMTFYR